MGRHERINKITSYGLLFLFLLIVSKITLSTHTVFGMLLTPITAILCAFFILESPLLSIGFGFCVGVISDILSGTGNYFYAICLTVVAFLISSVLAKKIRQNITSAFLCAFLGPILIELLQYGLRRIEAQISPLSLFTNVLPACLLSFVAAIPGVLILFFINRRMNRHYGN